MKKSLFLPLVSFFLIAGLCLLGCETTSPAENKNYKVSFDLNGAAGSIATQTIAEDAKVAQPADPTRGGYTFDDWYIAGATSPYNFDEAVKANFTLQARWLSQATDLSLSYDGQAVNSTGSNFAIAVASTVDVSALSLTFTVTSGAQLLEGSTAIALSNNTVTKEFNFSVNKTKTFNVRAEDGTKQATYTVTVSVEPANAKEITGFAFLAADNTALSADVEATIGVDTIKAVFPSGTAVSSLTPTIVHTGASTTPERGVAQDFSNDVTYTVTAENGETKTYTVTVSVQRATAKEITGFAFLAADNTALSSDVEATLVEDTIRAVFLSGTVVSSLTPTIVHTGASINPETGVAQDFSNDVTYTVTAENGAIKTYTVRARVLQAGEKSYIVSFVTPADATAVNSQIVVEGDPAQSPPVPSRENYRFDGWYRDASLSGDVYVVRDNPVSEDITLYSKWIRQYTVTFDTDNKATAISAVVIDSATKVGSPEVTPNAGYTFEGWYTDEATTIEYDFTTATVMANMTLYAKWTADAVETFTVSFNSNGGSSVESRTVNKDAKVDKPTDPEKEGYTFDGWYTDEATTIEYDFTTATVTANMTLYVKWAAAVATGFLIPDVNFRTALKENVSAAFEGEYMDTTHSSVRGLTALDVAEKSISSLAGIEYFTALTSLNCSDNSLTELDVTRNTALTSLDCTNNRLTTLDVTKNTALTSLSCSSNGLTALDVTKNTALTSLSCFINVLTALDVTKNTALTSLSCSSNGLTALDLTKNTALTSLDCNGNRLTALDVTKNTALTSLDCTNNRLTALDLTKNTALTRLSCGGNQLTALDVTKNTALTSLSCSANVLTALDLTKNTALTSLFCSSNGLTELDVTKNTALTSLRCGSNQLSSLDLRGRQRFTLLVIDAGVSFFGSVKNPLTELYVHEDLQTHDEVKEAKTNRNAAITISTYDDANTLVCADFDPNEGAAGACFMSKVQIPDENFRAYLKEIISDAFEGDILDQTHSSVLSLRSLDVAEKSIASLEGIEYFTALTTLNCNDNSLTALDVTQNTALTSLTCSNNSLTALDVTKNIALDTFYCSDNALTALNVTQNTALTRLFFANNELSSLNLTQNTALMLLGCESNALTELDVSKNTALTFLSCSNNSLTALDVKQNTALTSLLCQGNQLSSLDLRGIGIESPRLLIIDAGTATNPLTQLYVHTALQTHDEIQEVKSNRGADVTISTYDDANMRVCANFNPNEGDAGTCKDKPSVANGFLIPDVNFRTYLKEIISAAFEGEYMDTTHSSVLSLRSLDVAEKSIASLVGIEYFTTLTELRCNDNLLTALDVTQNTALTSFNCNDNSLTALDVTQNTALTSLTCSNNSLTALDVTKNIALDTFYCSGNALTALNVTQNTALTILFFANNELSSLNLTQNTALMLLGCEGNALTALDVTQNTALTLLSCSNNSLTALDVKQNTALTSLLCQGNQLSSLDLRGIESPRLLIINAGTATNPLTSLNIRRDIQTHDEIREVKRNRGTAVTITTYIPGNSDEAYITRIACEDFNPNEGDAGTCKD